MEEKRFSRFFWAGVCDSKTCVGDRGSSTLCRLYCSTGDEAEELFVDEPVVLGVL